MYARSTTVRGDPSMVDEGITEVRDKVLPALQEMEGFIGLSMLTDRETGRCIVTTSWEDERALDASRERVTALRSRATEMLGATADAEVREWEIVTLHRERPAEAGACARVTWLRVPSDRVDDQVEVFRHTVLPRLQDLSGFCSASLLVDRGSGLAAGAVVYESRDALTATRQAASGIRADATRPVGAEVLDVAEFEVALAHLRVPETV